MASSSSPPHSCKYDVFLSFRGEDTRKGIISHLYKELKQRRLDPFLDEPDMRTGHAISDELVNAINQSRASIVVISKNYASSSWVLNELLEILKCKETNGQIVVPLFYQVDPSHVRKQTGSFGEALEEHEKKFREGKDSLELARNIEKIQDWKTALTKIANTKGWDSKEFSESELVEEICKDIFKQLYSTLQISVDDSNDLVGMRSRMAEVEHLLELSSNEVRMVGIWGMGGIGKTTIATAIYQKIKSRDASDACGYYTESELNILAQKSLISYKRNDDWIRMHDLVRQMGRDIVRGEFCRRPETHKMLWDREDISRVLSDGSGTEAIEGIRFSMWRAGAIHASREAFKRMSNLKFLIFGYGFGGLILPDGLECLPSSLNYVSWYEYPLTTLPKDFLPINLVELQMGYSCLEKLWDGIKPLGKLKVMNLFESRQLKVMPDLSNATSLESLNLRYCRSLVEVSVFLPNLRFLYLQGCIELKVVHSVGLPVNLEKLNLSYCGHLKWIPDLSDSKNLRFLNLINCKSLVEFPKLANEAMNGLLDLSTDYSLLPDNLSCFNSLKKLQVKGMRLQQIPSSIMCLRNLADLRLKGRDDNGLDGIGFCCPSLSGLSNLTVLFLINLNIQKIPDDIDQLHELSSLDLSGNNFEALPVSIKNLSSLVRLTLKNCKRLKALPELPCRSLLAVLATGCTSLEQIHVDSLPKYSHFMNCFKLENSAQLIVERMTRKGTEKAVCLTGSEIPEWFGPESSGISGVPRVACDAVGFLSCILLPSESVRTYCAARIKCDYRFGPKSEDRGVFSKHPVRFKPGFSRDTDILQGDQLLVWYCKFSKVAMEADPTYDQVFFNFSIRTKDTAEYDGTHWWKAERFGVQLLFRKPKRTFLA